MARVKYVGQAHTRELSAADFKTLGVEGEKKTVFARKEPVEVSDEVLKVLTDKMPKEFIDAGEIEPLDDNSKKAAEEQADRDLTAAQQEKANKAAKKAAAAARKKEALPEEQELETGGHPQTTEGDGITSTSSTS